MKTALVTGSAGFIGRHMVRELQDRGWNTVGVDKGEPWEDALSFVFDATAPSYSENYYDLVVHCAYHVGGRAAIDGVNMNFAKNLQLDAAMFDWAVRTRQKRVLYFSSSAAYPLYLQTRLFREDRGFWFLEESDINLDEVEQPDANYGWAKLTGEKLAREARKTGLAVSVVRPFSGYGEDQSLDYPFPSIVDRAKKGDLTVWGPEGQTRDWIHVSDVVKGALAVVDSGTEDPVNLCTGVGTEMGDLMKKVYLQGYKGMKVSMWHDEMVTYDESKPTGVFHRVGDTARMLQYYTPQVSLEEGIQRALSR